MASVFWNNPWKPLLTILRLLCFLGDVEQAFVFADDFIFAQRLDRIRVLLQMQIAI